MDLDCLSVIALKTFQEKLGHKQGLVEYSKTVLQVNLYENLPLEFKPKIYVSRT
jgi:hypothetical protein